MLAKLFRRADLAAALAVPPQAVTDAVARAGIETEGATHARFTLAQAAQVGIVRALVSRSGLSIFAAGVIARNVKPALDEFLAHLAATAAQGADPLEVLASASPTMVATYVALGVPGDEEVRAAVTITAQAHIAHDLARLSHNESGIVVPLVPILAPLVAASAGDDGAVS